MGKVARITKAEIARIRVLNGQGFSDVEIAKKLGRIPDTISRARCKLGLPTLPQDCRARVEKLHRKGKLDREIAEELSRHRRISPVHVSAIRRSMGVRCNKHGKSGSLRRKQEGGSAVYREKHLMSDDEIMLLYGGKRYDRR